jgi:hypothetical protein
MAMKGGNTEKLFRSRAEGRVSNCDGEGRASNRRTRLEAVVTDVKPGTWELNVFGQNKFVESQFKLRVDYQVARANVTEIRGGVAALQGSFHWDLVQSSLKLQPQVEASSYELLGIETSETQPLRAGEILFIPASDGSVFHRFDETRFQSVRIRTSAADGKASSNDLDLTLVSCPLAATDTQDPTCQVEGTSAGESDLEEIQTVLKSGRKYAIRLEGYSISSPGYAALVRTELALTSGERGTLQLDASNAGTTVRYAFDHLAESALIQAPAFQQGKARVTGRIKLLSESLIPLLILPVTIESQTN